MFLFFKNSLNWQEQLNAKLGDVALPSLLLVLEKINGIVKQMESAIDEGDWANLGMHLEQFIDARSQFLGYLHQLSWWPQLNDTERLVALLLMRHRSTKEIANSAGLTPAYVNNVRSVLRVKLELGVEEDLSEYLIQEASQLVLRIEQTSSAPAEISNELEALKQEVKRVQSQRSATRSNKSKMLQYLTKLSQQLPDLHALSGSMDWARLQHYGFTSTERYVIELLVRGYSNGSIAEVLDCSMSRVYQCRGAIRSKLGVSRLEPLAECLRAELHPNPERR